MMAWWLIGMMADSYDSERLRGFCDGRTDGQTDEHKYHNTLEMSNKAQNH